MKDPQNMLGSIKMIPQQIQEALDAINKISFSEDYKQIKNIIVSGMGGSALGAHVIKSLYANEIKVPLEIVNDYHLPAYADNETLVILSTYSGSTEETLSCAQECLQKKTKVIGITTGGQLEQFLKENNFPYYKINPLSNPCGQPRIALGYSIFGQIAILNKIGLLNVNLPELDKLNIENIEKNAEQMAEKLHNKQVAIMGAEHLSGNAHIAANQLNENAKNFAAYFLLSELNHHLMEGLQFPLSNKDNLIFFLINSPLYSEKIQKRIVITKDIIGQNGLMTQEYLTHGESKLSDVVETLLLSSFLSFYLSQQNSVDPSPIPWVDYFKGQLSGY